MTCGEAHLRWDIHMIHIHEALLLVVKLISHVMKSDLARREVGSRTSQVLRILLIIRSNSCEMSFC